MGSHTQSAGTAEIARRSGGDSMPVDDASALETTLARIRQRYALHFHLPEGVKPGQERDVQVELADAVRRRYPDAEVRYRRVYISPDSTTAGPPVVARASTRGSDSPGNDAQPPVQKRRPAVNGPVVEGPSIGSSDPDSQGGWRRTDDTGTSDNSAAPAQDSSQPGWRRVKPGE
jgi:hypothetical protein